VAYDGAQRHAARQPRKADACITAAEDLIEQGWGETGDDGGDGDDSILAAGTKWLNY
jgi:hypothetical protein